jgi:hypothetical protein
VADTWIGVVMTALLFLDTETTGLTLEDDIWEFAAIRRESDGSQFEHHYFLQHDTQKCVRLPEAFLADHQLRFPASHDGKWHPDTIRPWRLAEVLGQLTDDRPHVVGAVPNFDTERLERLAAREKYPAPRWHYHLIDVETLAVGRLCAEPINPIELPWDSDDLSRACGVEPPGEGERHTAMGDARWAMRLYDAIMGGPS